MKHLKNVKNGSDDGNLKNNLVLSQQKARLSLNGQKRFSQIYPRELMRKLEIEPKTPLLQIYVKTHEPISRGPWLSLSRK